MSARNYYDNDQQGQGDNYGGGREQQGQGDSYGGGGRRQESDYEGRSNEGGRGGRDNDDQYNQQGSNNRRQEGNYGGGRENEYSTQPVDDGGQNRRHNNFGGGGGYANQDDDDLSGAAQHAERHAGSSGDSSIFSNVLSSLGQNKQHIANSNLNEQDAVQSHQQFFGNGGGSGGQADPSSMGSAAAMQALKMFSGGGSGNSQQGNSQNAFVGMAMAEASKLFDNQSSQGNVANGNKESTVQKAGEMALKMFMKSQGGGSGGGASGLMGLASKFL